MIRWCQTSALGPSGRSVGNGACRTDANATRLWGVDWRAFFEAWQSMRGLEDETKHVCGAGGVSKEFFQLLVRALFAADYGMFELNEETREHWFSPAALAVGASELDFRMVGAVLGLGIFNAIILDVHLPLVRLLCDVHGARGCCWMDEVQGGVCNTGVGKRGIVNAIMLDLHLLLVSLRSRLNDAAP